MWKHFFGGGGVGGAASWDTTAEIKDRMHSHNLRKNIRKILKN